TSTPRRAEAFRKRVPDIRPQSFSPRILPPEGSRIIFDTDDISFGEAINYMAAHTDRNYTYMFYIPSARLAVGSRSPRVKGEVWRL
ncbi:MAG: hypothetical protein GXO27_03965, partial [Chlorobi bacterium]|nr:hypothetical protein [Chlorobiota bacterium]